MPNIGLSDKNYERLQKLMKEIERNAPGAKATFNSVVGMMIDQQEGKKNAK